MTEKAQPAGGRGMSLAAALVRFGLALVVLMAVAGFAVALLGIGGNAGVNAAALFGAVVWSCLAFARANGRWFTGEEKTRIVLGLLAIDVVVQAIAAAIVAGTQELDLGIGTLLLGMGMFGLVHALLIWFFVGLAGRQFGKQSESRR